MARGTLAGIHTRWIKCIIERSAFYENNHEEVQKACKKSVSTKPMCATNDDLIFGDLRSVDSDVEVCTNGASISDDYVDYDIRTTI